MKAYNETIGSITTESRLDEEFFNHIPVTTGSADQTHLVAKTSAIHLQNDRFNATKFLESTSYVQISDPGIPGPEFDIPRRQFIRARPKQLPHRKVWELAYERFREQRMNICGLDLEPIPPVVSEEIKVSDSNEAAGKDHDRQMVLSEKTA